MRIEIAETDTGNRTQKITDSGLLPDARHYYDYLLNKAEINFRPRFPKSVEDDGFSLTLSKKMSYDQVSAKVGDYLGVDPTHLRFATCAAGEYLKPKSFVKRTPAQNLQQILTSQYTNFGAAAVRNDTLFYEVLETSLSDYETKKTVKVTWLSDGITKEVNQSNMLIFDGFLTLV